MILPSAIFLLQRAHARQRRRPPDPRGRPGHDAALLISAERGAQPLIKLASDSAGAALSGRYFIKEKEVRSSPVSYDAEVAARLWETSAALIAAAHCGDHRTETDRTELLSN